jgi:diguanylate cyclase (GGDEF)-like protein
MVDLDNFKQVNDSFGHMAGDRVLREISHRMSVLLRPYDTVGRYGGEEFLVVVSGCGNEACCELVAERLRKGIEDNPVDTPEGTIAVTSSFGVAVSCKGSEKNAGALIRAADTALYRAKEKGRNRVEMAAD